MFSSKEPVGQSTDTAAGRPNWLRRILIALLIAALPVALLISQMLTNSLQQQVRDSNRNALSEAVASQDADIRAAIAEGVLDLLRDTFGKTESGSEEDLQRQTAELMLRPPESFEMPVFSDALPTETVLTFGQAAFHSGYARAAHRIAEDLLAKNDSQENVLRFAALVSFELGYEDEVIERCAELAKLVPDDPRPWLVQAEVHQTRAHWPQLVEVLKEAVSRDSTNAVVRFRLAEAFVKVGNAADARKEFDALNVDPKAGADGICKLAAQIAFLEGNNKLGRELLEFYSQTIPNDADVLLLLGQIESAEAAFEAAIVHLERCLQVDPFRHDAHYAIGQAFARSGNKDKAREHLERHQFLLEKKKTLYDLERRIGREPHNTGLIDQLIAECDALGMAAEAQYWRATRSRIGGPTSASKGAAR